MLPRMSRPSEPPHHPDEPSQEHETPKPSGTWPFRRDDGYENPSLERYTDLRFEHQRRGHRPWVVTIAAVLALIAIIVLGFMVAIYAEARDDETREVDAIIVLGAAQWNCVPTDVFGARLQHALDLYRDGYAEYIIVTGGRQETDRCTEAGAGRAWLMERGVAQDVILMENEGRDTWGNLEGARDAAERRGIKRVLIVSDGFHLFRAERMANAVGFESYSSAAPDSPIRPWSAVEFSYVIRETVAVIVQIPRWLF